jgi:mono/diheme cytochrome c family protein
VESNPREEKAVLKKILVGLLILIVVAVAGVALYVSSRQNLKFDAPYPPVEASTDTTVLARGHYIVRNVANCASCHGDTSQVAALATGADVPLCGGALFDIPPGKFYVRNITPDPETGLGKVEAKAMARALRFGVGHDGRALLPFMEFQGLTDEDLVAVVSYLKSQPPVHNPVPMHEYNVLGKILRATMLANPLSPKETPAAKSPRGATVENGRYLVESVANCGSCHTQRDPKTGAFTGPKLGGSIGFEENSAGSWSPPNITSDPATGRLGQMTEDDFVTRFRAGRLMPNSPMPWQGFSRMSDDDLRAIYRYVKTVPPVKRDVGPPVVEKKAKA